MGNEVTIFSNEEFGNVRTLQEGDKILFCGSDVARALGYSNPSKALNDHCKGVTKRYTPTGGGQQQLSYIYEGDIYRLVARSKLPTAERFEEWVFDEVLPTIRKTGGYNADPRQLLIDNFGRFSDETKQAMILDLYDQTEQLAAKIEEDKPKVELASQIEASVTSLLIRDYCKVIQKNGVDIGEKRLYKWLIENKYLNDQKMPYQRYMDYFEVVERAFVRNGVTYLSHTTRITGKGQVYFTEKLMREFSTSLVPVA